jgi:hypothetical protein
MHPRTPRWRPRSSVHCRVVLQYWPFAVLSTALSSCLSPSFPAYGEGYPGSCPPTWRSCCFRFGRGLCSYSDCDRGCHLCDGPGSYFWNDLAKTPVCAPQFVVSFVHYPLKPRRKSVVLSRGGLCWEQPRALRPFLGRRQWRATSRATSPGLVRRWCERAGVGSRAGVLVVSN